MCKTHQSTSDKVSANIPLTYEQASDMEHRYRTQERDISNKVEKPRQKSLLQQFK